MRLNADIIFDNLRQVITVEMFGKKNTALALKVAKFYGGETATFQEDIIYVAMTDRLPLNPTVGESTVVVCLGGKPPKAYANNCCVMVSDETDILHVFDLVQTIFLQYDEWEEGLQHILDSSVSIQEMLDLSYPILGNPIFVLDSNFQYLAYTSIYNSRLDLKPHPNANEMNSMGIDDIARSIEDRGYNMNTVKPFLLLDEKGDITSFAVNLFVRNAYVGCMCMSYHLRQHQESDNVLTDYLAKMIEKTVLKNSKLFHEHVNPLESLLKDVLNGIPIEAGRKWMLSNRIAEGEYLCAKITRTDLSETRIPKSYIISQIEGAFKSSVVFEYEFFIIAFLPIASWKRSKETVEDTLLTLCECMKLKASVSSPFEDISSAWVYYKQASIAFDLGCEMYPERYLYPFYEYRLAYLVFNGVGELSFSSLMSSGLRRMEEHDLISQTSYIETLRSLLDNNMSITKTARNLHVHRSTLIERIKRIESLLEMDLEESDQQLYLRLILKAMEFREHERRKPPEKFDSERVNKTERAFVAQLLEEN